jgi:serine/threonine-protein kinase
MPTERVSGSYSFWLSRSHVGRFTFDRKIGNGAMAEVHMEQGRLYRRVAIKTSTHIMPELGEFLIHNEGFVLEQLDHPNIIAHLGHGQTADGRNFLAEEYFDGTPLSKMNGCYVSVERGLQITRGVLAGLAHAHSKGIVHGDMTPGNILIKGDQVKLIDFSFARTQGQWLSIELDLAEKPLTEPLLLGTPNYMSPGRLASHRSPNRADDVYAVGLILYQVLTGNKAINLNSSHSVKNITENLRNLCDRIKLDNRIPQPAKELILRMIDYKRSDRFEDAQQALEAIEAVIKQINPPPPPLPIPDARYLLMVRYD